MSDCVAVVGTINRDTITHIDGTITESYGGVLYNVTALSQLLGDQVVIKPCLNLGYDVYPVVVGKLNRLGNVKIDTVNKIRKKITIAN